MNNIKVAPDLSLPADLTTQVEVILAKRRAGKSYTMRRIIEQLLKADQQTVIVDPKGDQWGIRSSADGKKPGFPVLILGGEHGDLPLEVNGGEVVARLVVEERVSVLIDLSTFRKHEIATFMTAFLENLYRLKAQEKYRTPMKLVIDEADAIAPQKPQKGEERMLGAIEDIVRRGGQRGIGCELVTQRSAVLNKNVLTQAQMLIVLRTIAPQDLAAMKAWIDVHGTPEEAKELMASLPSLPIGDAWFWSPGWPTDKGIFKRVHVLPIETFDSGATPKPGQKRVIPKNLADVDLTALKGAMAATVEKAKQENPKALRAEVARLTAELAKLQKNPPVVGSDQELTKPMGVSQWREHGKKYGYWDYFEKQVAKDWEKVIKGWIDYGQKLRKYVRGIGLTIEQLNVDSTPAEKPDSMATVADIGKMGVDRRPIISIPVDRPAETVMRHTRAIEKSRQEGGFVEDHLESAPADVILKEGARRMLTVLVSRHPMKLTRSQLALLSDMSPKSSTFATYLSVLRTGRLIQQDGDYLTATDAGIARLGGAKPEPQSPEELREMWRGNLKEGARKMFDVMVSLYPNEVSRDRLAEEAGMSPTSSTFATYLSMLRTNGLVETKDGYVKAAEMLF